MSEPQPIDHGMPQNLGRWARGPVDIVLSVVVVLAAAASPMFLPLGVLVALAVEDLSGRGLRGRSPSRWIIAAAVLGATYLVWGEGGTGGWWWFAAACSALALLTATGT
jgi:hypothetical protein